MKSKRSRAQPLMNAFFHHGALGDLLITMPIVRALEGRTAVVAAGSKARLAARLVTGVTPIDIEQRSLTLLHAEGGAARVDDKVRDWLAGLRGSIVSFISDGNDQWARNVAQLAPRAALYFVDPRPATDWSAHVTDWFDHQLTQQGLNLEYPEPQVTLNEAGPIVIHPGSGGRAKCWPIKRFIELRQRLRDAGHDVRMIAGEVEAETWRDRLEDVVMLESFDELHDALAPARVYIGNDAGPTHLAAQMGLPTLALFGPTSAFVWAPQGGRVLVLAPPSPRPMTWLPVDGVLQFFDQLLAFDS